MCDVSLVVVTIWKTGTILLLLTQQLLPKTGSRRNALVSMEKTNGQRIRQISIHWIVMCGARRWV